MPDSSNNWHLLHSPGEIILINTGNSKNEWMCQFAFQTTVTNR